MQLTDKIFITPHDPIVGLQKTLQSMEGFKLKIVVLGPDGAGKSSVIQKLTQDLCKVGCNVKVRHLKPQIIMVWRDNQEPVTLHPHGKPPRSALTSVAKIFTWLIEEWYAHLFLDKQGTVLICDRYYHDLLVDPIRYRYGGPFWIARLVGRLMPQPELWLLLDAPADVLQARKQEVTWKESARQRQEYLVFVGKQLKHVIVDAAQSLDRVVIEVEHAIDAIYTLQAFGGRK
jgi:thymidylate kinase